MRKVIALLVVFAFVMFNFGFVSQTSALDRVTEKIPSVENAKEIAANAGGVYLKGTDAPALSETEVALPIMEKTGDVIGYIAADQSKLAAALDEAGYTEAGSAIAALKSGSTAGHTVETGTSIGTVALAVIFVVAATGTAFAVSESTESTGGH